MRLLPHDVTPEESQFINIIKMNMLKDLRQDRTRFVFLSVFEFGYSQFETAYMLGVHETEVSRQMRYIRERLSKYKKGYVKNDANLSNN